MLSIKTVPQLFKIIAKLDTKPIVERLKNVDVWDDTETDENGNSVKKLSEEKVGLLIFEIVSEITPQLGKIGTDIPEFVALYKGVSVEEAEKLDLAEVVNELINDDGVVNFFKNALKKRAEQEQSISSANITHGI